MARGWHDEAFSEAVARLDLSAMLRVLTHGESFNALYYALLHLWTRWGDGEGWLRLPSVAFGIGGVYVLFVLNRRLFGSITAAIASILLAIDPFLVRYVQEARPYSLTLFAVVLATYLFVLALDDPSIPRWIAYGAVSAVAIWAHVFSAWVVLAHILSLPLRPARPRGAYLVAGYGTTALLVAPSRGPDPAYGSAPATVHRAPDAKIGTLFLEFTGGAARARSARCC